MRQLDLFNPAREEAEAERGKQLAAERPDRREVLRLARRLAREIALDGSGRCGFRLCTADDVQLALEGEGHTSADLGNAAGSIFQGPEWRWTGHRVKSGRAGSHGNELKVWEYVGWETVRGCDAGDQE